MVPPGNKAESLLLVNHMTKTIHHHHHEEIFEKTKPAYRDALNKSGFQ